MSRNSSFHERTSIRGVNLASDRQPQILKVVDLDICNGPVGRSTVG